MRLGFFVAVVLVRPLAHWSPTMPDLSPTVVDPELTARLGQIVIRWASAEAWISAHLAMLVKGDPAGTMTYDYKRYGTTTLFGALNVLDGTIIGCNMHHARAVAIARLANRPHTCSGAAATAAANQSVKKKSPAARPHARPGFP